MNRLQLIDEIAKKKSYLCIGLDTDMQKLPGSIQSSKTAVIDFNKKIIDATKDYCVAYKINTAFYEVHGAKGWEWMQETLEYIPDSHFAIADAKRGDIGNTSAQYAKAFFETMDFDAITVAPYMGEDSIRPFLEYPEKFAILLALTSNPGAHDFETIEVGKNCLYERVIEKATSWGTEDNLMFVIGATRSVELNHIRQIIPDHFLLIPGIGAQGGSLREVSKYAMNTHYGILVNASRSILFASSDEDFAEKASETAKQYMEEMQYFIM